MELYCRDHAMVTQQLENESYRKDPYAVRRACIELGRLILARNSVRFEVVEDGVLPIVANAVRVHSKDHPEVLVECCRFLRRTISWKGGHFFCI